MESKKLNTRPVNMSTSSSRYEPILPAPGQLSAGPEGYSSASSGGTSRAGGDSGNSADSERSGFASLGPLTIGHKRLRSTLGVAKTKKSKILERDFCAAQAGSLLKGLSQEVPVLNTGAAALLRDSGIDVSALVVHKRTSSSVVNSCHMLDSSPRLDLWSCFGDSGKEISSLQQSCQDFYMEAAPLPGAEKIVNEADAEAPKSESTTSSVTNESGDEEEDGKVSKSTIMTIGDALKITKKARIIITGDSPYSLVHANAAFSRIMGFCTTRLHSRVLGDLLDDDSRMIQALASCAETHGLVVIEKQGLRTKSGSSFYNVSISPIGTSPASPTHFSIELRKCNRGVVPTSSEAETGPEGTKPIKTVG